MEKMSIDFALERLYNNYINLLKIIIFKQTVDKTLLVSTPEAFFLFWVQKVCT